ncbi:uncharacterized protein LOC129593486 isoform X2 [Paramacrobiotus metropolitanus]|uniref:uncharacterized protein LOC129593486 isoform X2 n=1 Tax=Paramacrobiotus metropolitanus TaxID=2943436 RepID=UPI0024462843|nr:uncharacterized protein LOC129593486 isoform X2 [Paramacrobiotus metropolitanus]
METASQLRWRFSLLCVTFLFCLALYTLAGPVGPYGRCPESNQSQQVNDRCRLRRFVAPRDNNALLQCASATSFDIRDALVRYAYQKCQFVLFLDIVSFIGNETLDLAEDTFDSIPTITTHLQLWGLTWIIPKNWNELTPFVVTNMIRQLHLVNMKFVPPDNTLPFDLFKGLDQWFHDWIVTNQFTMIFNGDPDCGIYNTNCYGNGLDGVWILSPDVDTELNKCTTATKLSPKSISLKLRNFDNGTDEELQQMLQDGSELWMVNGQASLPNGSAPTQEGRTMIPPERRTDIQTLDPISLECKPEGFRVMIPLQTSPVTKAEFWNFGNVTKCTSEGNMESSERMLVLTTNYTSCGTVLTDDEERLTFQNVIVVEHPAADDNNDVLIERVTFSMIPIVCVFMRTEQFSFLQTSDLQPANVRRMKDPLSGVNTAKVKIEIVNAVASALNNIFSFDIFAEAIADPRLSLMVETLYATPTNNSADVKRYDIIVDGCPKDGTLQSTPLIDGKVGFRFTMTPFKFRGNATNDVYLHGHAILCNNFSEKCEFDCTSKAQPRMMPSQRSLNDIDFDVVRYSKTSVLRAAEMI